MHLFDATERVEPVCEEVQQLTDGGKQSASRREHRMHQLVARRPCRDHFDQSVLQEVWADDRCRELRHADPLERREPERHHVLCHETRFVRDQGGRTVGPFKTPLVSSARRADV